MASWKEKQSARNSLSALLLALVSLGFGLVAVLGIISEEPIIVIIPIILWLVFYGLSFVFTLLGFILSLVGTIGKAKIGILGIILAVFGFLSTALIIILPILALIAMVFLVIFLFYSILIAIFG